MNRTQLKANERRPETGPAPERAQPPPRRSGSAGDVELDTSTVTRYLLDRGVLTPEQAVEGRLTVEDISRRNRNFRVRTRDGYGFIVKQLKDHHGESRARDSLLLEAQMLRFIATDEQMAGFRPYAPTYAFFDPRNSILVTELIHPATSITKLNLYYGQVQFPEDVAEAAGRLLGRYHKAGAAALSRGELPFLSKRLPNGLVCSTPQHLLNNGSPSGPPFWRLVSQEPFVQRTGELQKRWQTFDGIVHGDGRWMNYLLTHGEAPDGGPNLRVIDWEMAQIGDSAWDVTCYLGDYVRFALSLARVHKVRTPEEYEAKPPYPAERQHASARAFWEAYCKTRRLGKRQRAQTLERVIDYLPFYLALVGYELTESTASSMRELETMEGARLALHFARQAHETRSKFVQEWIGIDQ